MGSISLALLSSFNTSSNDNSKHYQTVHGERATVPSTHASQALQNKNANIERKQSSPTTAEEQGTRPFQRYLEGLVVAALLTQSLGHYMV